MTPDELARIRDNIDRGAGDGAIDRERLMAHIDGVPECPEVNGTTGRRCLRGTGHVGAHVNEFEQWQECLLFACYLPDGHEGDHQITNIPVRSPAGRIDGCVYVYRSEILVTYELDFTPRVARLRFSGMSGAYLEHVSRIPNDARYIGRLGFDL